MKITYIAEHTYQWYEAKTGLFSASGVVALLTSGTRPMTKAEIAAKKIQDKIDKGNGLETNSRRTVDTLFGKGSISYINQKVAEKVNGRMKETPTTRPMERGLVLEHAGLNLASSILGINFQRSGLFLNEDLNFGSTPDGIAIKRGKIFAGAEVKCLNEDKHSEICEFSGSMANQVRLLREYDESFYTQCQGGMLSTGAKIWYFISYDNRPMGYKDDTTPIEGQLKPENWPLCIKIIKVKRDEPYIEDLKYRLKEALIIHTKKRISRIKQAQSIIKLAEKTGLKKQLAKTQNENTN